LTVNVALADDASFEGGRLLALFDGQVRAVERAQGEATVHPATLLHGVGRMTGGVRYSLILFFRFRPCVDAAMDTAEVGSQGVPGAGGVQSGEGKTPLLRNPVE
jgi:hypothetical protein